MVILKPSSTLKMLTTSLECLEALRFENIGLRRDGIATAEVGTNHWIWSNYAYRNWKGAPSGLLWIQGKPGSGKSVLAKSIQKHLLQSAESKCVSIRAEPIVGSWFYSTRHGLESHDLMLRSLLLQILEQERSLFSQVKLRKPHGPFHSHCYWETEVLMEALLHLKVPGKDTAPICCIVDGLDESKDDTRFAFKIGSFFNGLLEQPSRFKIIVLSRPISKLEKAFRQSHRIILQEANFSDINKIINAGLILLARALDSDDSSDEDSDFLPIRSGASTAFDDEQPAVKEPRKGLKRLGGLFKKAKSEEQKRLQKIRKYLTQHASGVILWVTTVLKELEKRAREPLCDLKTVESELYRLPRDLTELYKKIVSDLQDTLGNSSDSLVKARRALVWVSVATSIRPLQLQELLDALAIGTDGTTSMKVHSWSSFYRQLQRLCGPFIEVIRPADRADDDVSRNIILKTDEV